MLRAFKLNVYDMKKKKTKKQFTIMLLFVVPCLVCQFDT